MSDPFEIVDHLAPQDALSILKRLARSDAALAVRIAEMALDDLEDIDPEWVAIELFDELETLKAEEVWRRAGKTRYGYVETDEAAYEMVKEILEPFLEELRRYQGMRLNDEVNQFCMGLLLGLYRFERESQSQFKDWAPDVSIAFAETVMSAWREGLPGQKDVDALKAFAGQALGWWGGRLFEGDK